MNKKVYLGVAIELVAALALMQPAHAFFGFNSPARVGLRDKISPDVKCPFPKSDWLSGSVLRVKGQNINSPVAPKGKCTHFELTDPTPSEIPLSAAKGLSVEGQRWQLGIENPVPGGFGPLAAVSAGLEPSGRMVVQLGFDHPSEFKVVAVSMDEGTNTVVFEAFFRACIPKPFKKKLVWLTCTPFIIPSGILIPLPEGMLFPVDIKLGKPFKLPASIKEAIAQKITEAKNGGLLNTLKSEGIKAGISAGSSIVSGGLSGGDSSSSSSGSSGSSSSCKLTSYGHKRYEEADSSRLASVPTNSSIGGSEKLDKDAAADFNRMRSAASKDGIDLNVVSGYRSVDSQKDLWDRQVAKRGSEKEAAKISAPPGYSEHHTGYAFDIGSGPSPNLESNFADTSAYKWLKKNAKKYGFNQSFTGGSSVSNEPWHWSYSGKSRAQKTLKGVKTCNSSSSSGAPSRSSSGRRSSGGYSGSFNGRTMAPVSYGSTSEFGPRRRPCATCSAYHRGLDYGAPNGTTVLAAADGVVVENRYHDGLGYTVWIDHGSGYMTHYSHLQKGGFLATPGTQVKMGTPIAISGNTGGASTGYHLHFGVKQNTQNGAWNTGEYIDPRRFLK